MKELPSRTAKAKELITGKKQKPICKIKSIPNPPIEETPILDKIFKQLEKNEKESMFDKIEDIVKRNIRDADCRQGDRPYHNFSFVDGKLKVVIRIYTRCSPGYHSLIKLKIFKASTRQSYIGRKDVTFYKKIMHWVKYIEGKKYRPFWERVGTIVGTEAKRRVNEKIERETNVTVKNILKDLE